MFNKALYTGFVLLFACAMTVGTAFANKRLCQPTESCDTEQTITTLIECIDESENLFVEEMIMSGCYVADTPVRILEMQELVAKTNNLSISQECIKRNSINNKLSPIKLLAGYEDATTTNNGKIYFGAKLLNTLGYHGEGNWSADGKVISAIAGETGSAVGNNSKATTPKAVKQRADRFSMNTLNQLPEFGWYNIISMKKARSEDISYLETCIFSDTSGRIKLSTGTDSVLIRYGDKFLGFSDINESINQKNGLRYDNLRDKYENALSQLAFVYSKTRYLNAENFSFEPNISNDFSKNYGRTRLIYKDSRIPNGYKVIGYFDDDVSVLRNSWNSARSGAVNGTPNGMLFFMINAVVINSFNGARSI